MTIQTSTFLWHEALLIWSWGPFTTERFHEISKDRICIVRFEIRGIKDRYMEWLAYDIMVDQNPPPPLIRKI